MNVTGGAKSPRKLNLGEGREIGTHLRRPGTVVVLGGGGDSRRARTPSASWRSSPRRPSSSPPSWQRQQRG